MFHLQRLCFTSLSFFRNRVRHVDEQFDLDLTYITDRIIGMTEFDIKELFSKHFADIIYQENVVKMLWKWQWKYSQPQVGFNFVNILLLFLIIGDCFWNTAMSFPGSGLETTYRNNLREVAKMLQTNHQDKYMVRCDTHLGHGWGWGVAC